MARGHHVDLQLGPGRRGRSEGDKRKHMLREIEDEEQSELFDSYLNEQVTTVSEHKGEQSSLEDED